MSCCFVCRAARALASVTVLLGITAAAEAQRSSRSDLPFPNVIMTNPFGPIYNMFTAEYERRVTPSLSAGVSGTYWSERLNDEFRQNSLHARVRFYPYEQAPRGFSIAVSGGLTRIRGREAETCPPAPADDCIRRTTTNPSFGVELATNRYMGPSQRFVLAGGLGVKRLFGDVAGDTEILPILRLNIGYAF